MNFIKTAQNPARQPAEAYYLIFCDNDLLVREEPDGPFVMPYLPCESINLLGFNNICIFGEYETKACYCGHISPERIPQGFRLIPFRSFYLDRDNNPFRDIAGYAKQIYHWNQNFQFCGKCGTQTQILETEHARKCPSCGLINYPRISPAIITAVTRGDEILLCRGVNFSDKEMFSVLAGFVEPNESLEDCVRREVFEETKIQVTNIRYFASQSWPFPDSLMIGFTAEYAGGEISIDPKELINAAWFRANALPLTPSVRSVSGQLIEWFTKQQK